MREHINSLFQQAHGLAQEFEAGDMDAAGKLFVNCIETLSRVLDRPPSREWSLVRTKLEEAAFWARRAHDLSTAQNNLFTRKEGA
jgi:hypothetical protein